MNFNEQLRKLYQERKRVKELDQNYVDLETENGLILIPKKVAIRAFNSAIEHYKSRIQYQQSIANEPK